MKTKIAITTDTHAGISKNTNRIHKDFLLRLKSEMIKEDCRILIHSGDWGTNSPDQVVESMRLFANSIPSNAKILTVFGNHDVWSQSVTKQTPKEIKDLYISVMQELGIVYLQREDYIKDGLIICGYDGWYGQDPATNDKKNISDMCEGQYSFSYLRQESNEKFEDLINRDFSKFDKKVLVTHMSSYVKTYNDIQYSANPRMFPMIDDKGFDAMIVGHSHREQDETIGSTRIINVGSDYDVPKFKIVEI